MQCCPSAEPWRSLSSPLSRVSPSDSIEKTLCFAGECVSMEYEACTTELKVWGNLLPQNVSISLAQNVSQCLDVDISRLTDIANAVIEDASELSAIQALEPLDPQVCIGLSDVHVEDGERVSFHLKIYIHAQQAIGVFHLPDVVLPGMDKSYDLGHLCYGRTESDCVGTCGYCGASNTCMLGNRNGPLCNTCAASYRWNMPTESDPDPDYSPATTDGGSDEGSNDDSQGGKSGHGKGHGGSQSSGKHGGGGGGKYVFWFFCVMFLVGGCVVGGFVYKKRQARLQQDQVEGMWGSTSSGYDPASVQTPVVVQGEVVHSSMDSTHIPIAMKVDDNL